MIAFYANRRALQCSLGLLAMGDALGAEIPRGRILENVACSTDATQTYALYIPSNFDAKKDWPMLLCFDPGARGKAPVERFQAAAERYGWLLAGSNNSRNGPWEANAAAIQAMVGDLQRHLPLDAKRIYAAGLSGGARVACQVAVAGIAHGVIACSAGFAGSETPSKVPFPVFGTAGLTDFNYRELRRVDRELEERRAVHRVVIFDGGHEWLPPQLAMEAVAWLELQAMCSGAKPKDEAWIRSQFEARRAAVPDQAIVENTQALKSLLADFKGLLDTGELEKTVAQRSGSREFRDASKRERTAERAEETAVEGLLSAASEGVGGSARKDVQALQAKSTSTTLPLAERAAATRILHAVGSTCGDAAREALRSHDYDTAAAMLEMIVLVRPERAQGHYDLARARAGQGDKKRALTALQRAVALGFKDFARMDEDKTFEKLRTDPAFVALRQGKR